MNPQTTNFHRFFILRKRSGGLGLAKCWRVAAIMASATLALSFSVNAQTVSVLINPGDQGGKSSTDTFVFWKKSVVDALRKTKLPVAEVRLSTDTSADLSATRSQIYDVYVAPAHVIGSAVRYGYTPLLGEDRAQRMVLVALKTNPGADLLGVKGTRLGRPMQDSLATYLLRGELNAANTSLKQHFSQQYESRHQDALLVCLKMLRCDVVAVDQAVFERWVQTAEPVKSILQSKETPGLSIAVKLKSPVEPRALSEALAKIWDTESSEGARPLRALQPKDFDYVSTLGYFTPNLLPGATLVNATEVSKLLEGGALYVDTRNKAEFDAGHVPGAKLIPYREESSKTVDFDADKDKFDIAALPADHAAALVFGCNGPECWKSFKATIAAQKSGYTKVYWFRDGLPGWRKAGNKVATGS